MISRTGALPDAPALHGVYTNYSLGKVRLGDLRQITSVALAQPGRALFLGGPRC